MLCAPFHWDYENRTKHVPLRRIYQLLRCQDKDSGQTVMNKLSGRIEGESLDAIQAGLDAMKPLPHRVEELGEVRGVRFVNDSKSTTAMSTALSVSQNTAVASSTFTVSTSDSLGYTLKLNASSTPPAMQSASSTIPDVTTTPTIYASLLPANTYGFGFSAYSTTSPSDVPTATWGTQVGGCGGSSVPPPALKYRGFAGATQITVAASTSTTTLAGNSTVVCYVVGQNNSYVPSGSYTATITATALNN